MLRWSVLALSVLVNLPVFYGGLVEQNVPVEEVLTRFLITVPIIAILLAAVRAASRRSSDPRG
ncbi:hypothetical protein SAMN05443575_1911 [Jatrophihabitans endophyticus]|uniref:Uncharacterized protein n=1 Tax=Jatrophihabitans endophyticus TaxID=1206085 RepID=A0A1M5IIX8_9ACTN|nr:hypothetical protein [Jatrophihabitans endophyticus]SHG28298.1 hypothetical protein SAMN05443575_1911 [Jatrophihabitans endophyticus]